jgi:TPR repeat protein
MKSVTPIIIRIALLGIFFTICASAYAYNLESLSEAQEAFDAGDYKLAMQRWRELAQQGNSDAQVFLGLAYANGWGTKRNMQKASMWYHIAAENGNPSGQLLIGLYYITNEDDALVNVGISWLRRAAQNGELSAQQFLLKAQQRNWFSIEQTMVLKPGLRSVVDTAVKTPAKTRPKTSG